MTDDKELDALIFRLSDCDTEDLHGYSAVRLAEWIGSAVSALHALREELISTRIMATEWKRRAEKAEAALVECKRDAEIGRSRMFIGWYWRGNIFGQAHETRLATRPVFTLEIPSEVDAAISENEK